MNNQIIDTQDGNCIWQTVGKLADGRQHACVRPVSEGVMTHGVFIMHEDGDIEWFSIHPSLDSAVTTLLGYTGDLTVFSAPVESGKFP